ncbi:MAG: hypothetical protein WAQ25_00840 [Candidatus Saccharimonas sp.]
MKKVRIVIGIGIVIAACLGVWWLMTRSDTVSIMRDKAYNIGFTPLWMDLPSGYSLAAKDVKTSNGILVASVTAPNNARIVITQQRASDAFSTTRAEGKKFRTLYGQALVQDFDDQTLGTLVSPDVVVLINAKPPIGANEMEKLINSLKPLDK